MIGKEEQWWESERDDGAVVATCKQWGPVYVRIINLNGAPVTLPLLVSILTLTMERTERDHTSLKLTPPRSRSSV